MADPLWHRRPGALLPYASRYERGKPKPPRLTAGQAAHRTASRIAALTGEPVADLLERLNRDSGFVYLIKDLSVEVSTRLSAAIATGDLPGVHIEPGFRRHHPSGKLAGALLGRENWQGNVEGSFAQMLVGQTIDVFAAQNRDHQRMYFEGTPDPSQYSGSTIELTIDKRIQAVAEQQLELAVRDASAEFGVAVVVDIGSNEVLAMAQYPGLDPDDTRSKPKSGWRNRAIQDQFEPGSTLKVLTYAVALAAGKVRPDEMFVTAGGLSVPGKLIKDAHPHGTISAAEAIKFSSNVAMGKMALRVGRTVLDAYLRRFGLGHRTEIGLADEIGGTLHPAEKWLPVNLANIAFGQGVAVTALQMANAFAAIGRGGVMLRPRLIRAVIEPDGQRRPLPAEEGDRVVPAAVARQAVDAMALVCEPGGTGRRARIEDYKMVGKTGTAQQVGPGGYSPTHWVASFIGIVPREEPRLAIYVAVDTPRKRHARDPNIILRTGGEIAAPVVREIARFALPYLGVPKSPGAPWLAVDDPVAAKAKAERLAARPPSPDAAAKVVAAVADAGPEPAATVEVAAPALPPRSGASDVPLEAGAVRSRLPAKVVQAEAVAPITTLDAPDLRGMTITRALQAAAAVHLALDVQGSGVVESQVPAAGAPVRPGETLRVKMARRSSFASAEAAP